MRFVDFELENFQISLLRARDFKMVKYRETFPTESDLFNYDKKCLTWDRRLSLESCAIEAEQFP